MFIAQIRRILLAVSALGYCAVGGPLPVDAFAAERRVALAIGNASYINGISVLANSRNDAQDVASALGGLGFEVLTALDSDKLGMDAALQAFTRLATDADSALFFYSGHALQYQGKNYLLATDTVLTDGIGLPAAAVSLSDISAALNRAKGAKIIMLDACRNITAVPQPTRGLAPFETTPGSAIVFATAANNVSIDGGRRNSLLTRALLRRLQEPGLEFEMMLRRVTFDVVNDSNGKQRPAYSVSLPNEYYLNQNDQIAWDKIKDDPTESDIRKFLNLYPSSALRARAQERLAALEKKAFDLASDTEFSQCLARHNPANISMEEHRKSCSLLAEERDRKKEERTSLEKCLATAALWQAFIDDRKRSAPMVRLSNERRTAQDQAKLDAELSEWKRLEALADPRRCAPESNTAAQDSAPLPR